MSRYRLILEGEFPDTEGLCERVAMCLEPLGDVRVVKVLDLLAGCGVCQHGIPVEGSFYTKVKCNSRGAECVRDATDHCMRFVRLNIMDRSVLSDAKIAKEYERRIEKFNRLVAQDR
jgi:hypothetical protein